MNEDITPIVYFYHKPDCHLCEHMARELDEFKDELAGNNHDNGHDNIHFYIVQRNIEDDPDWYENYREYIPTLVLEEVTGQREICYYFLDKDELKSALLGMAGS